MANKEKLIELSNAMMDLFNDLFQAGATRPVWESLGAAHEILLEQIEDMEEE